MVGFRAPAKSAGPRVGALFAAGDSRILRVDLGRRVDEYRTDADMGEHWRSAAGITHDGAQSVLAVNHGVLAD